MASLGFSFINGDHNAVWMGIISQALRKSWLWKIQSDTTSFMSLGEWSNMIERSTISGYVCNTDGVLLSIFAFYRDMWDMAYGTLTLFGIKFLRNTRKEGTHGGCLNNSASISYSGISCGLNKINSFGPLFPSCLHSFPFSCWPSIHD